MDKVLIIIAGMPGTGKTRFANYLANKLQKALICKDKLKEIIWDKMHYDTAETQKYGGLAYDLSFHFCEMLMKSKQTIIFESNFGKACPDTLKTMVDTYGYKVITILFGADVEVVHKRFVEKPLVIATTGFDEIGMERLNELSKSIPVMQSGNFSIALHDFIETLKFAVSLISEDTDISIIEAYHNQKQDAPSGTAIMIQEALIKNNSRLNYDNVHISSIRGGSIVGEHQVIFANCSDEVTEYKHKVSSREALATGAIEVSKWLVKQPNGFYNMDDFCKQRKNSGLKYLV